MWMLREAQTMVPIDLSNESKAVVTPDCAVMNATTKIVYWHRELPPLEATAAGEHTVEANSGRTADTIACRQDLWNWCRDDLMIHALDRLTAEVSRLGGR